MLKYRPSRGMIVAIIGGTILVVVAVIGFKLSGLFDGESAVLKQPEATLKSDTPRVNLQPYSSMPLDGCAGKKYENDILKNLSNKELWQLISYYRNCLEQEDEDGRDDMYALLELSKRGDPNAAGDISTRYTYADKYEVDRCNYKIIAIQYANIAINLGDRRGHDNLKRWTEQIKCSP